MRLKLGLCDGCAELSWHDTGDPKQGRALVCRRMSLRVSRMSGREYDGRFSLARASEATEHDEKYLSLYYVKADCERGEDYRSLQKLREL